MPTWKNFITITDVFGCSYEEVIGLLHRKVQAAPKSEIVPHSKTIHPNKVFAYLEIVSGEQIVPPANAYVTFASISAAEGKLLECLLTYAQADKQFLEYLNEREGKLEKPKKKANP